MEMDSYLDCVTFLQNLKLNDKYYCCIYNVRSSYLHYINNYDVQQLRARRLNAHSIKGMCGYIQ